MSNFESVKVFMRTFGQEIKDKPGFPTTKITQLRFEEFLNDNYDAGMNWIREKKEFRIH